MENLLKQVKELRERLLATWELLDINRMEKEVKEQKEEMNKEGFWDNQDRAVEISKKVEELDSEIDRWSEMKKSIIDLEDIIAVSKKEGDTSLEKEVQSQYEELKIKFEKLEFFVLFSGKYDKRNAILSIHAGTGGVDAQDWAEILERMFLRFAEKMKWRPRIVDRSVGNEAGIKSVTIRVAGRYSYGYLKSEAGVHRLVRISPFDAEAMRHTSFALVEVIPELPEAQEMEINEEELRIDVFRSSGPGGQSVNTTDSAVRIVHIPTKTTVTCQSERSQHQNKENAIKILKSKLYSLAEEKREREESKLRGEVQRAEWGKQIRSYVLQPYKMVKDHRTNYETQDVDNVLDGELDKFIESYLKWVKGK